MNAMETRNHVMVFWHRVFRSNILCALNQTLGWRNLEGYLLSERETACEFPTSVKFPSNNTEVASLFASKTYVIIAFLYAIKAILLLKNHFGRVDKMFLCSWCFCENCFCVCQCDLWSLWVSDVCFNAEHYYRMAIKLTKTKPKPCKTTSGWPFTTMVV